MGSQQRAETTFSIELYVDAPNAHLDEDNLAGRLENALVIEAPNEGIVIAARQPGSDIPWIKWCAKEASVLLSFERNGIPGIARGVVQFVRNRAQEQIVVIIRDLKGVGLEPSRSR